MARKLRQQYEGAFHHVYARGDGGETILAASQDKRAFIDFLVEGLAQFQVNCHAYCIMDTHYHLILDTPICNLSELMHLVGSAYGSRLSRKGWIGHVFSGRFCSKLIQSDNYLAILSKYIHLNPVKATAVSQPAEYRWSSYPYYIKGWYRPDWLQIDSLLGLFDSDRSGASKLYRAFVETKDPGIESGKNGVRLKNGAVLEDMLPDLPPDLDPDSLWKLYESPLTLDEVHKAVCSFYGVEGLAVSSDLSRDRLRHLRRMFVYLVRNYTTAGNPAIVPLIGNVSSQAVSQQYNTFVRQLEDPRNGAALRTEMEAILEVLGCGPPILSLGIDPT